MIEGRGPSFDENPALLSLLNDPALDPCLLFPGPGTPGPEVPGPGVPRPEAIQLRARISGKRPAIIVVDGTWHQAKKMVQESRVLSALPRVEIAPRRASTYGFRRQPAAHCLSTVEAVHEIITRIEGRDQGAHDVLLEVFSQLVRTQVRHATTTRLVREP